MVTRLEAPAIPPPTMPELDESVPDEPVAEGFGRLIISTDVPSSVSQKIYLAAPKVLCSRTPCVVTLPFGEHELVFHGTRNGGRVSTARVTVRAPTVVLNHTLGQDRPSAVGAIGAVVMVMGALVMGVGMGLAEGDVRQRGTDTTAGRMIVSGLAASAFGGVFFLAAPSITQPGSSREWTPGRAQATGLSLGGKF